MSAPPIYRGRFAPSPTGLLHFGSLVTALGSCLDARSQGGEWLVRMEDLDRTRERPGAADAILRTLDTFGFEWDGPVVYQSRRDEAYREALERLVEMGMAYRCGCSRREILEEGRPGPEGPVYSGRCREVHHPPERVHALRVRTHDEPIRFADRLRGEIVQRVEAEVGDFVIRRADGLFAYQLAVVVDDAWQGINRIVRGADLLLSTPRQIHLQTLLGLPQPTYLHLPLVRDPEGRKLSKQDQAHPVDPRHPIPALRDALNFLGQAPPDPHLDDLHELWAWALAHWDTSRVPAVRPASLQGGLQHRTI